MPERERLTRRRWLWVALLLVVLVALGWRVVSLGLADHWALDDAERALAVRPDHPRALFVLAERSAIAAQGRSSSSVPSGDARGAGAAGFAGDPVVAIARRALRAYPLEGRPFRILAQRADAHGEGAMARRLYAVALARAPRDLATRAWLVDHYFGRGRVGDALVHFDALLRLEPAALLRLIPQVVALASLPQTRDELVKLLAKQPPWRADFMARVVMGAADSRTIDPFIAGLRRSPGGMTDQEMATWTDRLMIDGRFAEAYVAWVSGLSPAAKESLANVFNGGFELAPRGVFDWQLGRATGAFVDRAAIEGGEGDVSLHLAFTGRRVAFEHVSQVLLLPPGRWRLQARVKTERLETENGLAWQVSCLSGSLLGATEPLSGRVPWRSIQADFQVPAAGCPVQRLRLQLVARSDAERWVSGEAWFDDIRVVPAKASDGLSGGGATSRLLR